MFKEERDELKFDWSMIGDIGEGRPNLGNTMDVSVYRLMQFTLRDVLIKEFDAESADRIFYEAGRHAGKEFCKELITPKDDFNEFVVELQELLKKLKIGILRIEQADLEQMNFMLTVAEDLDCSGLPASEETICTYDTMRDLLAGCFPSTLEKILAPKKSIAGVPAIESVALKRSQSIKGFTNAYGQRRRNRQDNGSILSDY
jgi:predicted hydrocarbon binding protein